MCSHDHEPMSFARALAAGSWPARIWAFRLVPLLLPVWLYKRLLSPLLPRSCRYEPTCSEYMFTALAQRGIFSGLIIGALRILRCHPWGGSGFDPVEAFRWPWQRRD
jgi:hypothetical protein